LVNAVEALNTGGTSNGYRVLCDASDDVCRLLEARSVLENAIAAYRSVALPTDDDYDEQQENDSEEARMHLATLGFGLTNARGPLAGTASPVHLAGIYSNNGVLK
jgi:hypothetical protein